MVLYQDGGAWGREEERGSQQSFFAFTQLHSESACVPWIGGHETSCTSFWPSCGEEELAESESFCLIINLVDCLRRFLSVLDMTHCQMFGKVESGLPTKI